MQILLSPSLHTPPAISFLRSGHLLIIQFSRGNCNQGSFLEDKWFCYGARGGDLVDIWTRDPSRNDFRMHSTLSSYFQRPSQVTQQWFCFQRGKKTSAYSRRTLGIAFLDFFFILFFYFWQIFTLALRVTSCKIVSGLTIDFLFISHGKYL